jgi:general secretion pathway protein E
MARAECIAFANQKGGTGKTTSCLSIAGYLGRIGIFEVLTFTEEVKQLVIHGATAGQIRVQAIKDGMVPMSRDGMLKVKEGIITVSEVLYNTFSIS